MWTIRPTMHATRGDPSLSSLVLRQALKKSGTEKCATIQNHVAK